MIWLIILGPSAEINQGDNIGCFKVSGNTAANDGVAGDAAGYRWRSAIQMCTVALIAVGAGIKQSVPAV